MYTIKNNTKITITNKKTGKTTILLSTKYDDERKTGSVPAGLPLTESVDNSLDTFVFIYKGLPTRKLFSPYDCITFTVDDGIEKKERTMLILSDRAESYSRAHRTFTHTVTCIENVKILEKIKIFNLVLTNESDTLSKQFTKVLKNAEPVWEGGGMNIESKLLLATELNSLLNGKKGRDFYFENTDLRTVLDTMLAPLNCRATVTEIKYADNNISAIYIGYRSMNAVTEIAPEWTFAEQGEIGKEELENDGQDYAGKVVARGYNTLAENPITFTDCFKSNQATISDKTAMAFLPFPVSEKGFASFKINVKSYWTNGVTESTSGLKEIYRILGVDISDSLIPSENYELLSDTQKKNYIPYEIGSNSVWFGRTKKGFLMSELLLDDILRKAIVTQYVDSGVFSDTECFEFGNIDSYTNFWKQSFTCTFYPIIDTVSKISKPGVYDEDELMLGIMDSQREKTLDADRHGKRLASLIKRTGNAEYYIDVRAKSYSKLLPLMAKINMTETENAGENGEVYADTDYVVYKKECAIYDNYVNCRYYLSKDFNAIHQDEGVNREKHLFDIPLESNETPLLMEHYLVFSTEQIEKSSPLSAKIVYSALNTLVGKNESETNVTGKLNYLLFQSHITNNAISGIENEQTFPQCTERSDDSKPYFGNTAYYFMRPNGSYAQDRVMSFVARTLDNYSVDFSRDGYKFSVWGDKGNMISYNRYVSYFQGNLGECDSFMIKYAFKFTAEDNAEKINQFPVVDENDFVSASDDTLTFHYHKDRTQRPLFVLSLECIPSQKDYGKILVGSAFARLNNLIRDNGDGLTGIKLVLSKTKKLDMDIDFLPLDYNDYIEADVGLLQVEMVGDCAKLFVNEAPSIGDIIGGIFGGGTDDSIFDGIISWAVIDEYKNVLLGMNGNIKEQPIYLTVRHLPC